MDTVSPITITNCPNLTELIIEDINMVKQLAVETCPALSIAGITSFSNMTAIEDLTLKGIGETGSVDLTFAQQLQNLDLTGTPITSVQIAEAVISNPLVVIVTDTATSVTIPPLPPATTEFILTNSYLTTYDFSTLPLLTLINITDSDFSLFDVTTNSNLSVINAFGNKITSLTLPATPNSVLTLLNIGNNLLTGALNLGGYSGLTNVNCDLNALTNLTLPSSLQLLSCSGNPALAGGALDCSAALGLIEIIATTCNLSSINVSANTVLDNLIVNGNNLTSLMLTNNTVLTKLQCNDNPGITALNLASNTLLESLRCTNCHITSLDVSSKPNLTYLQCDGNDIDQAAADTIVAALVANGASDGTLIIQSQLLPIGNLTITGGNWTTLANPPLNWTIS